MEAVRSGLRDDINHATRFPAKFSIVIRLGDVEFADCVRRRIQHYVVVILIRDADTVHQKQIVSRPLAQNIDQLARLLQASPRVPPGGFTTPEPSKASSRNSRSFTGRPIHLLIFDYVLDLRRLCL